MTEKTRCHRTTLWNSKKSDFKVYHSLVSEYLGYLSIKRTVSECSRNHNCLLNSRLLLPAYDVTEVFEEKARAITDKLIGQVALSIRNVGQIFGAWSWVHFLWGKRYNFGVKTTVEIHIDFDIFNSHLNCLNKKFLNNIPVTNSQWILVPRFTR